MKLFFLFLFIISVGAIALVFSCELLGDTCSPISGYYLYLATGGIHLALISAALFFLWKKDVRTTLANAGFRGSIKDNLIFAAIGLSALFILLIFLGIVSIGFGFNDQRNVSAKVDTLPLLVLAFAVIGAPFTEELFFRAFMVPRVGIIISAILFGILHFTYGSVVEILGAFMIGTLLGALFRMSKSIVPCILVHLVYNLFSLTAMKLVS